MPHETLSNTAELLDDAAALGLVGGELMTVQGLLTALGGLALLDDEHYRQACERRSRYVSWREYHAARGRSHEREAGSPLYHRVCAAWHRWKIHRFERRLEPLVQEIERVERRARAETELVHARAAHEGAMAAFLAKKRQNRSVAETDGELDLQGEIQ